MSGDGITIPHLRVVVAASALAVGGYALFSAWVVILSRDAALIGDTIGTWKSFAVLAFGFWLGSSSGGKARPNEPVPENARQAADRVANAAANKADEFRGS